MSHSPGSRKVQDSRKRQNGSIGSNFLFASITNLVDLLVSVAAYPYTTRVLGPENFGKIGIVTALLNYVITAALFGLPVFGIRQTARLRAEPQRLAASTRGLVRFGMISTLVASSLYALVVLVMPAYAGYSSLALIYGLSIAGSVLSLEWFYQGMERFRFIAMRNLAIKLLYLASIFIFVKNAGDVLVYAGLYAGSLIVAAFVNGLVLRFSFPISNPGVPEPPGPGPSPSPGSGRLLIAMAPLALSSFLFTAYTNLDFVVLGLVSSPREAGLYSISIRLCRLFLTLFATLNTALLPRLSALAAKAEPSLHEEEPETTSMTRLIRQSLDLTLILSLPGAAILLALAKDVVAIFGGAAFADSIHSLRILAFMVPVAAISAFLQMQVLIPSGREKTVLRAFGAGVVVAAGSLFLVVPASGHEGAALAMAAGELAVLLVCALGSARPGMPFAGAGTTQPAPPGDAGRQTRTASGIPASLLRVLAASVAAWICASWASNLGTGSFVRCLAGSVAGAGAALLCLVLLGDPLLRAALSRFPTPKRTKKR